MVTVKELKEQCKKRGIKGYSKLKKKELEQVLKQKPQSTADKKVDDSGKKPRCPKGFRRSKKTGNCEKTEKSSKEKTKKLKHHTEKVSQEKSQKGSSETSPKIDKDIPILSYKIGEPISKKEAMEAFIKNSVHLKQGQVFVDPITLDQYEKKDLVELKENDEIMSKETFHELLDRNMTTWCGKENVGFKSPIDGTIFGNLVLYNYNPNVVKKDGKIIDAGFFPQKPGTLSIQEGKSYFTLTYKSYRFYIPNTSKGKVLLCMMKDAFKKGNLFAFSNSGRIRHGRVHKKTSLHGAHGFPDEGYVDRCLGELNALGSSPYIYSFSKDKNYEIGVDPYPKEKRWKIQLIKSTFDK